MVILLTRAGLARRHGGGALQPALLGARPLVVLQEGPGRTPAGSRAQRLATVDITMIVGGGGGTREVGAPVVAVRLNRFGVAPTALGRAHRGRLESDEIIRTLS